MSNFCSRHIMALIRVHVLNNIQYHDKIYDIYIYYNTILYNLPKRITTICKWDGDENNNNKNKQKRHKTLLLDNVTQIKDTRKGDGELIEYLYLLYKMYNVF